MTRFAGCAMAVLAVAALLALAWDAAGRAAREGAASHPEPRSVPHAESSSPTTHEPGGSEKPVPRSDAAKERRLALMRAELAATEADAAEAAAQLAVDRVERDVYAQGSEHEAEDPDDRDRLAMLDALVDVDEARVSQYEAFARSKEAEIRIEERRGAPQSFGEV